MKKRRIASLMLAATITLTPATILGHPGRTDSSGGHKDNKNKSGLGSYHFHCGGNSAHLHDNGVCPYSSSSSSSTSTKSTSTSKSSTTKTSTSNTKKTTTSTSNKTDEIKKAQEKLNELGYDCGTPDGKIGKNTTAAIKKFQEDKGLTADGILGTKTKKELGI